MGQSPRETRRNQDLTQKDRLDYAHSKKRAKILKTRPKISTGERQAIMASTYKREAMVAGGKSRIKSLKLAAEYYEKSGNWEKAKEQNDATEEDNYGLLQAATMNSLWGGLKPTTAGNSSQKIRSTYVKKICERVKHALDVSDNFWKRAMAPDLRMAQSFVQRTLADADMGEIARQYIEAAIIARDLGQLASVIDNIEFMALMIEGIDDPKLESLHAQYLELNKKLIEH